jgi:hypothetical protein
MNQNDFTKPFGHELGTLFLQDSFYIKNHINENKLQKKNSKLSVDNKQLKYNPL